MSAYEHSQTRLARSDNGFEVSLDELARTGEQPLLWSIDGRLRIVSRAEPLHVTTNRRDVVSLRLASGRQMHATAGQQILKVDGWAPADGLTVGSRIAALRRLPPPAQVQSMHESEIIMLAHMIGDGSCVKRQPIRYASIDEANIAAVTIAAAHFGVIPIRDEYAAARVTTLRLPAPYRLARGKRNPIAEWLDELGLFGLRSYEKFVPAAVFALDNEQIALFLRHLWATDGSVRWDAKTAQGRVYYASTSRRLIDDVMSLLLRVGVQSRITKTGKANYRDCWFLTIDRAVNQLKFLNHVGVHGERAVRAREVVAELSGRVRRPGTDTIPVEIWDHVKMILAKRNWSDQDFAMATNTRFDGPLMWTHAPGRVRLHRIASIFADPGLHDLATSDIYWDKVVDVANVGRHDVYELTTQGSYPLVINGVVVRWA